MSWYKISQEDIPGSVSAEFSGDFIDDIESSVPPLTVKQILDHYGLDYKEHIFPKLDYSPGQMDPIISVKNGNDVYVIEGYNSEYPDIKDASDWLWRINDMYLPMYFAPRNENFWDSVGSYFKVYHGTKEQNIESIKKDGLIVKKDSRGLRNRSTPSAVFTSLEPEGTVSYGNIVIEIDMAAMKKDGYMPPVEQEEPVVIGDLRESLARLIGLDEFYDSSYIDDAGIKPDTLVIYGNIPPKYLSFLD